MAHHLTISPEPREGAGTLLVFFCKQRAELGEVFTQLCVVRALVNELVDPVGVSPSFTRPHSQTSELCTAQQ
jgi:hypothetical protein